MKDKKLSLNRLRITSFVTSITPIYSVTLKGGNTQGVSICDINQTVPCISEACHTVNCITGIGIECGPRSVNRVCLESIDDCSVRGSNACNVTVIGCSRIC